MPRNSKLKPTPSWKKNGFSKLSLIIVTLIMLALMVSFLYPLFFLVSNSLKSRPEYYQNRFGLPWTFTIDNFRRLLIACEFGHYFLNSLFISVVSTFLVIFISIFVSYALAKIRFRGREIAYFLIISTMLLPDQVSIIPEYVMFAKYHLINHPMSVILAYLGSGIPGTVLLLRGAYMGIPDDLIDSGKIDGAGYFTLVCKVATPLAIGALVIQIIFKFLGYWNDAFTPMMLLDDQAKQTIMVAIRNLMTRYSNEPTLQYAGLLFSVAPCLIVYLCMQKYLMKGLMLGAVKS